MPPWKDGQQIEADPDNQNDFNAFSYEEPTMCLGSYLVALACEEKEAYLFGIDRARTKDETRLGLLAYERIDKFAETYSTNVHNAINPTFGSQAYPGTITNFHRDTTDHGDLNGFFLRDDVPWEDLVEDNYLHFNRPARRATDTVVRVSSSSFRSSFAMYSHRPTPTTYYPDQYPENGLSTRDFRTPNEESQDQLVNLVVGMGLTIDLTEEGYLKTKAGENLHRMLHHVGKTNYSSLVYNGLPMSPFVIVNEAHPTTGGPWLHTAGPLTIHTRHWVSCVDGIAEPTGAGNWMGACGAGVVNTAIKLTNFLGAVPMASNLLYQFKVTPWHHFAYWMTQFGSFDRDWHFAATFAAFADDWTWVGYAPVPSTWERIKEGSLKNCFQNPHLPLLRRLHGPGVYSGLRRFDPTKKGEQSYESLLNSAPPCGPFMYKKCDNNNYAAQSTPGGCYWNIEWSGNDRLTESYHGWAPGSVTNEECHEKWQNNAEYNGLDYMMLFGLYALVKEDYMQGYFNSYYEPSFRVTYPDANFGGLGSKSSPLKLHYLEYLGLRNRITKDANVRFHGAKAIELLSDDGQGNWFETQPGAVFEAYIQDHNCNNDGTYIYAEHTNEAGDHGTPITYCPLNPVSEDAPPRPAVMARAAALRAAEEAAGDDGDPPLDSVAFRREFLNALEMIYESGDDGLILGMERMLREDSAGRASAGEPQLPHYSIAKRSAKFRRGQSAQASTRIHPNPTTRDFTLDFPADNTYQIEVTDLFGQSVLSQQVTGLSADFSLTGLAAGSYTVTVRNSTFSETLKLVLLPE